MGTFFLFINTGASLKIGACENEDKTQELTDRVTQLVISKFITKMNDTVKCSFESTIVHWDVRCVELELKHIYNFTYLHTGSTRISRSCNERILFSVVNKVLLDTQCVAQCHKLSGMSYCHCQTNRTSFQLGFSLIDKVVSIGMKCGSQRHLPNVTYSFDYTVDQLVDNRISGQLMGSSDTGILNDNCISFYILQFHFCQYDWFLIYEQCLWIGDLTSKKCHRHEHWKYFFVKKS